jgi:hypothetical protein
MKCNIARHAVDYLSMQLIYNCSEMNIIAEDNAKFEILCT